MCMIVCNLRELNRARPYPVNRSQATAGLLTFLITIGTAAAVPPEQASPPAPASEVLTTTATSNRQWSGCRECHYCAEPTAQFRCLIRPCRRDDLRNGAAGAKPLTGPDVIIMDAIEGAYLPVPFDHQGHAEMAAMTGGCITCHHFTREGEPPPPCRTCHEIGAEGTDIHKPGLKGAYHQQCMNCHRDWVDETDCSICHQVKAGSARNPAAVADDSGRDDLTGRTHPPIPEPQGEFFQGYKQGSTTNERVVFRHREHVERFGLNCVDCHHEPSCTRCHTRDNGEEHSRSLSEHHRPCLRCHKRDMDGASVAANCERCHWQEGRPMPAPFDHAATGWPLKPYHQGKGCRGCHPSVPFVRRERDCSACHGEWSPATFDHQRTGQVLDENHAEVGCAECHADRKYDVPPTCDECHDDDSGVTFPGKRPGPVVGAERAAERDKSASTVQ